MADQDGLAAIGGGHAPRIGSTQIDVVQQDRVHQLLGGHVNDAQRIGVHPAAFQLRRGHLVAR
jgi:hypothetical protein